MSSVTDGASSPATVEADRLRQAFERVARVQLAAMAASARAIVRAWAEAEVAIDAARRSGEPLSADLPRAEAFRARPYLPREEVSRERITRWCRPGLSEPLDDERNAQVVRHSGAWVVMPPGSERPSYGLQLQEMAEFDRTIHLEPQGALQLPSFVESLAVPALVAGGSVGWEPIEHFSPAGVLAQLDRLDAADNAPPAERERTVAHTLVHRVSPPQPAATVS